MKMVVAYIDRESVEPIRETLLGLGFVSISAWEASGSFPEAEIAGQYRGVAIEKHMRPKVRLECIVGDDQVMTIVDTVLQSAAERRFVFVVAVEDAFPKDTVNSGEMANTAA
jgi:nitrogen regulatory protein P-II 1